MNDETINLAKKNCLPCEGGVDPIDIAKATNMMNQLDAGWELQDEGQKIFKEFRAKNHYEIVSIINLIIWISHKEDHHPEITGHKHLKMMDTREDEPKMTYQSFR